jgi:hypothetical protein
VDLDFLLDGNPAGYQSSGDHRPEAAHRERTINGEAQMARSILAMDMAADVEQRGTNVTEPISPRRTHRYNRCTFEE